MKDACGKEVEVGKRAYVAKGGTHKLDGKEGTVTHVELIKGVESARIAEGSINKLCKPKWSVWCVSNDIVMV